MTAQRAPLGDRLDLARRHPLHVHLVASAIASAFLRPLIREVPGSAAASRSLAMTARWIHAVLQTDRDTTPRAGPGRRRTRRPGGNPPGRPAPSGDRWAIGKALTVPRVCSSSEASALTHRTASSTMRAAATPSPSSPPTRTMRRARVGRRRRARVSRVSSGVSSRGTSGAAPQRRRSRGRSAWRSPARVPRCALRESCSRGGALETAAIDGGARRRRGAGRRSRRGSPERADARPAGPAAGRQRAGVPDPAAGRPSPTTDGPHEVTASPDGEAGVRWLVRVRLPM